MKRPLWIVLADAGLKIAYYLGKGIVEFFLSLARLRIMLLAVGVAGIICFLSGSGLVKAVLAMIGMLAGMGLVFLIGFLLALYSDWYRCSLGLEELF